jgi:hypothetical protein
LCYISVVTNYVSIVYSFIVTCDNVNELKTNMHCLLILINGRNLETNKISELKQHNSSQN